MEQNSNLIIYQTEDGLTKIETRLEDETVWLTQAQLCELFQKSKATISEHIKHIFDEGGIRGRSGCSNYRTTTQHGAIEGKTQDRQVKIYNLDVIISVGYRVKSLQGTKFRQWATARLREYIVKGFTMNDDLLKQAGGGNYFDELLARIRDIRSSEKVFWRKVLDIYATSIDYDPKAEVSMLFFKTVQNKMHWAAHGNTAAEVIFNRIDAGKPHMGLTAFKGTKPTKEDIKIAKNYLNEEEINILNRVVTAYLEVAELQALNRKPMYMKDWIARLDDFLRMTGNDILTNAGSISHEQALLKANQEYLVYKERIKNELSQGEQDFVKFIDQTGKTIEQNKKKKLMEAYKKYKDSGVEWLGKIPEHWEVRKMKLITSFAKRGSTPNYTESSEFHVVNQATFSKGYIDYDNIKHTDITYEDFRKNRGRIENGDLLIASTGGGVLGKVAIFNNLKGNYLADSHVTIVRFNALIGVNKFFYYFFSINYNLINGVLAQGSTNQTELQGDWLLDFLLPLPPPHEQEAIAIFLDGKCEKLDEAVLIKEKQIEKVEGIRKLSYMKR